MLTRFFRRTAAPAATPDQPAAQPLVAAKRTVTIDLDAPDVAACKEVFRAAGKLWGRSRPSEPTGEAPKPKGRPRKVKPVPAPVEAAPPADSPAK